MARESFGHHCCVGGADALSCGLGILLLEWTGTMITLEFKSGPLEGQRLDFSGGRVIIGRGSSCDCVIDDPKVSTVHCLLEEGF